MKHYNYHLQLKTLWQKAVDQYTAGQRGSDNYFQPKEIEFLRANGVTAQELYDYAEDYVAGGDPDFTCVAMVTDIRRSYFIDKQQARWTGKTVLANTLPGKSEAIAGVTWLPRIIAKAKAKLRGELDPDTMYGCGGDRAFLQQHDIHPAEFLRVVAANENDEDAILKWIQDRSS